MARSLLRSLSKSQLERVVRHATLKQHAAQERAGGVYAATFKLMLGSLLAGLVAGGGAAWWWLR